MIIGVTAAGNSQSTATPLSSRGKVVAFDVQVVPTGSGVRLQYFAQSRVACMIRNSDPSNALLVYPLAGGTIDGSASPKSMLANTVLQFWAFSPIDWVTFAGGA